MNRAILSGEMYITESGQILLADPELEVGGEWCRHVGADLCPGGGLGADLHLAALAAPTQGRGHADRGLEAGGYRQQGRSWWLEAGGQWRQGRREGENDLQSGTGQAAFPDPRVPVVVHPPEATLGRPLQPGDGHPSVEVPLHQIGAGLCQLSRERHLSLEHRPCHFTGQLMMSLHQAFLDYSKKLKD